MLINKSIEAVRHLPDNYNNCTNKTKNLKYLTRFSTKNDIFLLLKEYNFETTNISYFSNCCNQLVTV